MHFNVFCTELLFTWRGLRGDVVYLSNADPYLAERSRSSKLCGSKYVLTTPFAYDYGQLKPVKPKFLATFLQNADHQQSREMMMMMMKWYDFLLVVRSIVSVLTTLSCIFPRCYHDFSVMASSRVLLYVWLCWLDYMTAEYIKQFFNSVKRVKITSVSETIRRPPLVKAQTALKTKKYNMAKNDFQYCGCNVARSWHWFRQVSSPCNVACGTGIMTVNSPSGNTLQCDKWLWDDMPLNSPDGSTLQCDTWLWDHDIEFAR